MGEAEAQVGTVIGNETMNPPVRLIRACIDDLVRNLAISDPVKIERLVLVLARQLRVGLRLGIAAVIEAAAVLGPLRAAELHPLNDIRQIFPRSHIPHMILLPVTASLRGAVDHQLPILTDGGSRERDRAVLGECVGIDQHPGFRLQALGHIDYALILETGVAREKVAPALFPGLAEALIVPQLRQSRFDLLPLGDGCEKGGGHSVLRLHPGFALLGVVILQPTVGISHGRAVVDIHDIYLPGGGILDVGLS